MTHQLGTASRHDGAWEELIPQHVETVSACTADYFGRLIGKRLSRQEFVSSAANGIATPNFHLATDAANTIIKGLKVSGAHTGFPNGYLVPSPQRLVSVPWDPSTMLALCDVVDSAFQPVAEAPREVLRHQVNQLAERGLIAQVATELEFYAFRESFESAHSKKFIGLVPFFHRQGDHDVLVTDVYDEFLRDVRQAMTSMAVTPLAVLGEGGLGQVEMNFPHDEPLLVADRHVLFKHAVRALAQRHGHSVTFMAKYDVAEPGSSCHVHLSLWQHDGTSASESGALRGPLRDFLAGLLEFLPDFQLAFTPNPNSFSRLAPGSWAPVTRTWGFDNRTVMVRVLGDGVTRRLEFRLPGADANPYIALAGILAAGIAGLDDKPDLPEPSRGDAYSQNDRATVHRKLGDAIRAFDASARAADAFGKDVHQHLVLRANAGDDARTAAVTDWDRSQGFESF